MAMKAVEPYNLIYNTTAEPHITTQLCTTAFIVIMIGNEVTLQNFKIIRLKLRFSHCYT